MFLRPTFQAKENLKTTKYAILFIETHVWKIIENFISMWALEKSMKLIVKTIEHW